MQVAQVHSTVQQDALDSPPTSNDKPVNIKVWKKADLVSRWIN